MQAFCDVMLCHWVSSSPGFWSAVAP